MHKCVSCGENPVDSRLEACLDCELALQVIHPKQRVTNISDVSRFFVYRVEFHNNKVYIGVSKNSVTDRLSRHRRDWKREGRKDCGVGKELQGPIEWMDVEALWVTSCKETAKELERKEIQERGLAGENIMNNHHNDKPTQGLFNELQPDKKHQLSTVKNKQKADERFDKYGTIKAKGFFDCTFCGVSKSQDKFHANRSGPNGIHHSCSSCHNQQGRLINWLKKEGIHTPQAVQLWRMKKWNNPDWVWYEDEEWQKTHFGRVYTKPKGEKKVA